MSWSDRLDGSIVFPPDTKNYPFRCDHRLLAPRGVRGSIVPVHPFQIDEHRVAAVQLLR